jgi:lipopolysaccharide export LptBFGC system permease protein LptF
MYRLAATRFNELTWQENINWRKKNNHTGCIYGTPSELKSNINTVDTIFVLEMHNTENKIKGIGIIHNQLARDKNYYIYSDGNYNRYTYQSAYRIDINDLTGYNKAIVEVFDILLFKTKKHIKRAQGITELPTWILTNKHFNFIQFFRDLFRETFALPLAE